MSKTFCVQPWLGKELDWYRETRVCCWLPENYDLTQIRYDLLNGVKSKDCNKCWKAEENAQQSRRIQQNMLADTLYDLSIQNIRIMCERDGYNPTIYQVGTSNLCNGACIMCSGEYSTKWQSLNRKPNYKVIDDVQIHYDTAKFVEFVGGEPLVEKRNLEILEQLNPDCVISLVTNGSAEINKKLLQILAKFKRVIVCMSIDGIERVFEYQRWPLQWNKLLENLTKFRDLQCDLSVSYTLTNINLPYKQKTIDWFNEQQLPYIINEVKHPPYFDPNMPIGEETIQELDRQDSLKGIDRRDYGFNF